MTITTTIRNINSLNSERTPITSISDCGRIINPDGSMTIKPLMGTYEITYSLPDTPDLNLYLAVEGKIIRAAESVDAVNDSMRVARLFNSDDRNREEFAEGFLITLTAEKKLKEFLKKVEDAKPEAPSVTSDSAIRLTG